MTPHRHVSTLLLCAIVIGCGTDTTKTSSTTSPADSKLANSNEMPQSDYEVADIYTDLRNQVLQLRPDAMGHIDADKSTVIAVLMETGYPEAVATLVAVSDGTSSLYFSNGGGIIGGGEYDPVSKVCGEFMTLAQQYVSKSTVTKEFPLPQKDKVRCYLVTRDGVYTFEALQDDLGNERHACSPLFHKGHELITAIQEHTPE